MAIRPTHSNTELLQSNNDWKKDCHELSILLAKERALKYDVQQALNAAEGYTLELLEQINVLKAGE